MLFCIIPLIYPSLSAEANVYDYYMAIESLYYYYSIVYGMIKKHRDNENRGVSKEGDLLYTLLQAQDTEAGIGRMNDTQLRDEVMTI